MKYAITFGLIVAVAIVAFGIITRPQPTAEQITAQVNAEIARKESDAKIVSDRIEMQAKIEAQKSDTVKSAEIVGDSVNTAVGAYVGVQLLKAIF